MKNKFSKKYKNVLIIKGTQGMAKLSLAVVSGSSAVRRSAGELFVCASETTNTPVGGRLGSTPRARMLNRAGRQLNTVNSVNSTSTEAIASLNPRARRSGLLWSQLAVLVLGVAMPVMMALVPSDLANRLPLAPEQASAATSNQLNFQGRLLTNTGALVPDGVYNMEFNLYNVASGGSTLWTEDRLVTNTQGVSVQNGYYSVYLGQYDAFPAIDWSQDLYLGMTIRGTSSCAWGSCTPADSEMTPRFKLTAVPYAFRASNVASSSTNAASSNSDGVSITTGNALGATSNSGNITVDVGTATGTTGTISLGSTNASALTIGRTGVTTTLQGSVSLTGSGTALSVTNDATIGGALSVNGNTTIGNATSDTLTVEANATFNGSLVVSTGDQFTNAGSTVFTALAISDVSGGGNIGSAASTVDVATTFDINQTTAGQTLTLPNPTSATSGRMAFVNNVGSASFTMYGSVIATGKSNAFIWNGSAWVTTVSLSGSVVNTIGTIDSQTKSADGAVISSNAIYLQTADISNPGLVSIGAQTFNGVKTFDDGIVVTTGGATISAGNLVVDTNTLVVDATNNKVGIGTTTPTTELEVVGDITSKGTKWTTRTSSANNNWRSIAYGNGLFVAVAHSGTGTRVMTSPDGINWTTRTSASNNNWRSVAYGNGMFVAVAESGTGDRVMTSPDGITWTTRTSAADNNWQSVTYGGGLFVAVATTGTGDRVMTSPDGVNWTSRTSADDNGWTSVAYGNGLFVAVANSGSDRVMTSSDGTTWSLRSSVDTNSWQSVTYGQGLYVAVAVSGTGDRVQTSPDGITWTSRTSAADNNWNSVVYGNGTFVAVAYSGTGDRVMTSPDGSNWTSRASAADHAWAGVAYGNGTFVAVACGISDTGCNSTAGTRVMTSGKNEATPFSANNTYTGGMTVYGSSIFRSDANSTTAFQFQNASGTNVLSVNTTTAGVDVTGTLTASGLLRAGTGGTNGTATGAGDLYVQDALEVDGGAVVTGPSGGSGTALTINQGTSTNVSLAINGAASTSANFLQITGSGEAYSSFVVNNTGLVTIRPVTGGDAIALRVQSADGTLTPFSVNTSTGLTSTFGQSVNGNIGITGAISFSGASSTNFTTPQGSSVSTRINIPLYDPGSANQLIAMGLPNVAASNSRAISLFDNRAAGDNQPVLSVFSPDETDVFGLSSDGSNSYGYLKATSGLGLGIKSGTTVAALFETSGNTTLNYDLAVNGGDITTASGDLTIAPNGGDTNITGNLDVSGGVVAGAANEVSLGTTGIEYFGDSTSALRIGYQAGIPLFGIDTNTGAGDFANIYLSSSAADGTTTTKNSGEFKFQGSYYNGSANYADYAFQTIITGTTAADNYFALTNTADAEILTIDQSGNTAIEGALSLSDGSSNYVTFNVNALAGDYDITIPTITANDTMCLLVLGNCAGAGREFTAVVGQSGGSNTSTNLSAAGHVADGTSDEDEINAAITAVNTAGGGKVLLLEGTYFIDGTIDIKSDVELVGSGVGATIIKIADSTNASMFVISESTNPSNFTIRDLSIDANDSNNTGTQGGIAILTAGSDTGATSARGPLIENVEIHDLSDNGIYFDDVNYGTIADSHIYDGSTYGIWIDSSDVERSVVIRNNNIHDISNDGVNINDAPGTVFSGNTVKNSGQSGLVIGSSDGATVADNYFYNSTNAGIEMYGGQVSVTGNHINTADYGIYGQGIGWATYTGNDIGETTTAGMYFDEIYYSSVTGNTIYNSTGNGIELTTSFGTNPENTISANNISNIDGKGILLVSTAQNNVVTGNNINTIGLEGIDTAGADYTQITGNTIYNFATVTAGSDGIAITGDSDNNSIIGNRITDGGSGQAIDIGASADNTYLADNVYGIAGALTINNAGTNTRFANQISPASILQSSSSNITSNANTILTGSIDPIASTTVTGVGTFFTRELQVGDKITVSGETRTVATITDDDTLTVDSAFSNNANDTSVDRIPAGLTITASNSTTSNALYIADSAGAAVLRIDTTTSGASDNVLVFDGVGIFGNGSVDVGYADSSIRVGNHFYNDNDWDGGTGSESGYSFLPENNDFVSAGTSSALTVTQLVDPTSGTRNVNNLLLNNTINQTGGASGITRGLSVSPTLTAFADYRGLEVSATSSYATANNQQGSQLTVTDTGNVSSGTDTTIGQAIAVTRTGASGTSVLNNTGLSVSVTGDTNGTSTNTGLTVSVTGADTNYAALFSGGNVGIGDATPAALLTIGSSDAFQVDNSGNILTAGDATIQGGDLTVGVSSSANGSLVLLNSTNAFGVTLNAANQTAQSTVISFPDAGANATDTICLVSLANCAGAGREFTAIVGKSGGSNASLNLSAANYTADGEAVAGTGTVDGDQVEINNAIDAVAAAGGGKVLLLEGEYNIDGPIDIDDDVEIIGSGTQATYITISNTTNPGTFSFFTEDSNPENWAIRDLTINMNSTNNTGTLTAITLAGIGTTNARAGIISNIEVHDFNDASERAITVTGGADNLVIEDSHFWSGEYAISFTGSGSSTRDGLIIRNNTFEDIDKVGMLISSTTNVSVSGNHFYSFDDDPFSTTVASILLTSVDSINIDGNMSSNGTQDGVNTTNVISGATISGNTFETLDGEGIEGQFEYSTITGNTFSNSTDPSGMYFTNTTHTTISANHINSGSWNGIAFGDSGASTDNTITGNAIGDTITEGIYIGTGSVRNVISSNQISNSGTEAISVNAGGNNIIGNTIYNYGVDVAASDGIAIIGDSDANRLVGNHITDTAGTGQAIDIRASTADGTYLADNQYSGTGAATISDSGTGTVYASQYSSSSVLEVRAATTQTLTLDTGTTGTVNLGTGTSGKTVNIGTGAGAANTINLGGTGANIIGIGNTQTAGSISLGAALTTGTINIGGTGAQTGTIDLGVGTGAQAINLGTGGTGAKTVTLGSTASTSSTVIQAGSGGIALNNATVTTNATTVDFFNTTATTVNAFGAATSIVAGAVDGTTWFYSDTLLVGNSGESSITGAGNAGTYFGSDNIGAGSGFAIFRSGEVNGAAANSGAVTLQSGASTTSGNTGIVSILSGNATSGNSGNIVVDAGTATGTAGTISLGTANTSGISLGRTGISTQVAGDVNFDSDTLFVDESTNFVGIGINAPDAKLHVQSTNTGENGLHVVSGQSHDTGFVYGTLTDLTVSPGADTGTGAFVGNAVSANIYPGATVANDAVVNFSSTGTFQSTGNLDYLIGYTSTFGYYCDPSCGTVNGVFGYVSEDPLSGGGTMPGITNNVGVAIEDRTRGTNQTNILINASTIDYGSVPSGSYSIYNGSTKDNLFAGDLFFGNGDATAMTVGTTTRTTNAAGANLTVQAGAAGSGASAFAGGVLTLQGGSAGGTGNANGGNVALVGGIGTGTGVKGLVLADTFALSTAATQNCTGTPCAITQANVDSYGAVLITTNASGYTVTLGDPTLGASATGRLIYVTNADATDDFVLSANGGTEQINLKPNTTATMIWNGSDWTAAGASSSTDLQAAYDNTAATAGGAEVVLSNSGTKGLTIRNDATSAIVGGLLEVQSSIGSNLFTVNNNAVEYADNGGAESSTFTMWTAAPTAGGTISQYTTAGDNIATGAASVSVDSTSTANTGVRNTLNATLTRNLKYRVSFAIRHTSSTTPFTTLDVRYSPTGTATDLEDCSTANTVNYAQWTRITCTFTYDNATTPNGSNAVLITHSDAVDHDYYIDNLSVTVSADVNHAVDGSVDVALGTNWQAIGGSVARSTSVLYDTSGSVQVTTSGTAGRGVYNNLTSGIIPQVSTQYRIAFYARGDGTNTATLAVAYTPDNNATSVSCSDYNTQVVSATAYTLVTCLLTTSATTPVTSQQLRITQSAGSATTFYVDALTMTLNTNNSNNVQIGGANKGGPVTLFTLDRSNGAPIAANNDAYLGSMYYDTSSGRIQCYEADGWGACGAAPDNIVNLNPEYAGAVLNGSGVGTMTADFCSNQSGVLDVNTSLCSTGQAKNFYRWTSPQATQQTYSIYVTYQLPATFNGFSSDDTVQLTARVDNTSNASVTYEMFKSTGSAVTQCGTGETNVITGGGGSANTWYSYGISGNEATGCSFNSSSASNFVIFKINMKANSNANAYVSTLSFTTTGR